MRADETIRAFGTFVTIASALMYQLVALASVPVFFPFR